MKEQYQNKLITSWDDGSPYDLKVAELLDKYGFTGTFYVPITNRVRKVMTKSQIRQLASRFEIGGHTYSHTDLTSVSPAVALKELVRGKAELEGIIGRKITKFCFPWGRYNRRLINFVKSAGFETARTARIFYTGNSTGSFLEKPNLHVYNHNKSTYMASCLKHEDLRSLSKATSLKGRGFLSVAKECYKPGFHIWGHSWEIEDKNLWRDLDDFLKYISCF